MGRLPASARLAGVAGEGLDDEGEQADGAGADPVLSGADGRRGRFVRLT